MIQNKLALAFMVCSAWVCFSCNVHDKDAGRPWANSRPDVHLTLYSGECFNTPTMFTLTKGMMVKDKALFDPNFQLQLEGAKGVVYFTFKEDYYTFVTTGESISAEDPNVSVVRSVEFWYPEGVTETKGNALLRDFFNNFGPARQSSAEMGEYELGSSFLMCDGGASITSGQAVFGEEAGSNLISHFSAILHSPVLLHGLDFRPECRVSPYPAKDFFLAGDMIPLLFGLITTEQFDGPVTCSIDIPVQRVMYLSYLRDRKRNENAELELVPLTLHATFTLENFPE